MFKLRVTVEEIRGFCDLPAKVGDYFEIDGGRLTIPPGQHVCIWALSAMLPFLAAKQRNIADENDWVPQTSRISCPDPNGLVIYNVQRISSGTTPQPPKRILVQEDHCTGCRRCELACSMKHRGEYGVISSRIRVDKDDHHGVDRPLVCRQCGTAKCVQACPQGALSRDPVTNAIVLDAVSCTKCHRCVSACPFSAIHLDYQGYPFICDLCDGDPECVKVCPTGAIRFGRAGEPASLPRFVQPGKVRQP